MKFTMTCTCGDVVPMEAANREEAVGKYKTLMTEDMIAKHMAEKHPGQPLISVAQAHMMIDQGVVAA